MTREQQSNYQEESNVHRGDNVKRSTNVLFDAPWQNETLSYALLRLYCFSLLQVVHATAATDDKKLQSCLKKLSVNTIPGIEEVNMIKDDGTVIHFNNPKAQASLSANTFAITGHGENKQITEMLPGILSQLGPEGLTQLKRLASTVAGSAVGKTTLEEDDEVPDLVENFDEASKEEVKG